MSTLKEVGKKLWETKLASQKVELALADDIKSEIQKYKGLKDNIDKANSKAKDGLIAYVDNIRVGYQNANNVVSLIDELIKKSKELGLGDTGYENWRKDFVAKAAEYKKLFTQVDNISKSL